MGWSRGQLVSPYLLLSKYTDLTGKSETSLLPSFQVRRDLLYRDNYGRIRCKMAISPVLSFLNALMVSLSSQDPDPTLSDAGILHYPNVRRIGCNSLGTTLRLFEKPKHLPSFGRLLLT